eukprot:scaffold10267_cov116-Isochrysis_galbana.AAC.3
MGWTRGLRVEWGQKQSRVGAVGGYAQWDERGSAEARRCVRACVQLDCPGSASRPRLTRRGLPAGWCSTRRTAVRWCHPRQPGSGSCRRCYTRSTALAGRLSGWTGPAAAAGPAGCSGSAQTC